MENNENLNNQVNESNNVGEEKKKIIRLSELLY